MSLLHRIFITSDVHYGADWREWAGDAPGGIVSFQDRWDLLMAKVNDEINGDGLDYLVINGDLSHYSAYDSNQEALDSITYVRNQMVGTGVPFAASYGNHERITESEWQNIFGFPRSNDFVLGDYAFILPRTSDESGARTGCFEIDWIKDKIKEHEDKKGVIGFVHIPPFPDEAFSGENQDCTDIRGYYSRMKNLIALLHGHFHSSQGKFSYQNEPVESHLNGHFGQYGSGDYGYQILEIYDDGIIKLGRYNAIQNDWDIPMTDIEEWKRPWNDFPWGQTVRQRVFLSQPQIDNRL